MAHQRIYIAEADQTLQRRLAGFLKKSGFEVESFGSGYAIVAMMDNWPDVFLIDIELPGVNGIEVCKWLKSHDNSRHVPVIFISSDSYLKVLAAPAHADDYIEKPIGYRELIEKINNFLCVDDEH